METMSPMSPYSLFFEFAIIRVSPFLNNLKDLDPSFKTDQDLWNCFGKKKTLSYNRKKYGTIEGL